MTSEIITLHLGQCGNKVGFEFWRSLCAEHGISFGGAPPPFESPIYENRQVFFYEAEGGRFMPRAVLVDLEPRVINSLIDSELANLFNSENICLSQEGGGAGNNWASGFSQGKSLEQQVFDVINREAEASDSFQGFILSHGISGGTGSGLSSYMIEQIAEKYPKKTIQTYSVFPNEEMASDIIVQPYNALLTLKRLALYAHAVFMFENSALNQICSQRLGVETPTNDQINQLVARVMTSSTSTLRFPTYMHNSLACLTSPLMPIPPLHFLVSGYTPLVITDENNCGLLGENIYQATEANIMQRLLEPGAMMISNDKDPSNTHSFIAMLHVLEGATDIEEVYKAWQSIYDRQTNGQMAWSSSSAQFALAPYSPYRQYFHKCSGLMIGNHTCVSEPFRRILQQYSKLRKRRAFLDQFQRFDLFKENLEEFDDARNICDILLHAYQAATTTKFREWSTEILNK